MFEIVRNKLLVTSLKKRRQIKLQNPDCFLIVGRLWDGKGDLQDYYGRIRVGFLRWGVRNLGTLEVKSWYKSDVNQHYSPSNREE